MKNVLVATEKPFSESAITKIVSVLKDADYNVTVLSKYSDVKQLYDAVANANAMIVRSDKITPEVISHAPDLEIVVRAGAGFDNIDLLSTKERGIVVENTPGQNANAVAELVAGMTIMACRNFYDGSTGFEMRGKRIGIHGFGNVGKSLSKIANGMGMYVFFYDTYVPFEESYNYGVVGIEDLNYFYKNCQIISLHIPLRPETAKSVNYDLMMSMPKDAILINTARSEIIDEDALLKVFEDRSDFRYLADVSPTNKDIIAERFPGRYFFTPKKLGAQTSEANMNAGVAAANQIVEFFTTGSRKFQVNK